MLISPGPKENRDCPFGVCTDIEKVPEPERVIEAAVEEEDSPYSMGGSRKGYSGGSKEVGGRSGNDNSNILIFPGFEGDQVKWVPTCQKLEKDLAQGRKDGSKGILNTDLEIGRIALFVLIHSRHCSNWSQHNTNQGNSHSDTCD